MGDREGDLTFENKRMNGARFHIVDLTGARFDHVRMRGVAMRGVELVDVQIDGEVWNVTINGVDVAPLIDAELNRRYPDRIKMRPADPAGFREAWVIVERLWDGTVARARQLDPVLLHAELWVADIVYRPLETALLQAARAAGCRVLHGGHMAVHQAADTLRLVTGREPDVARMLSTFAGLVDRSQA